MHADHFIDLAGLRYLFPWAGRAASPLPVHLPPGGRSRLDALATAISERPGFFDAAFMPSTSTTPTHALTIGAADRPLRRGRHYVPAWAVSVEAPDGARLVYTGDTGPSDAMIDSRAAPISCWSRRLRDAADDDPSAAT